MLALLLLMHMTAPRQMGLATTRSLLEDACWTKDARQNLIAKPDLSIQFV
jgi:hypothetical protein